MLNAFLSSPDSSEISRLAVNAIYQRLMLETKRFQGKSIQCPRKALSPRMRDRLNWDLKVFSSDGTLFEAILIRDGVPITLKLVSDVESCLETNQITRIHLLSTSESPPDELLGIKQEAERIFFTRGCEIIVGGVMPTIKYYLRLLDDPYEFIECYVNLLEDDRSIKFEHKQRWNELIEGLI